MQIRAHYPYFAMAPFTRGQAAKLAVDIRRSFETLHALHVLEEKRTPFRFFPGASGEQATAGHRSLESLHEGGFVGTTQQFRNSAEHANTGEHVGAVVRNISQRNPLHVNSIKKHGGR